MVILELCTHKVRKKRGKACCLGRESFCRRGSLSSIDSHFSSDSFGDGVLRSTRVENDRKHFCEVFLVAVKYSYTKSNSLCTKCAPPITHFNTVWDYYRATNEPWTYTARQKALFLRRWFSPYHNWLYDRYFVAKLSAVFGIKKKPYLGKKKHDRARVPSSLFSPFRFSSSPPLAHARFFENTVSNPAARAKCRSKPRLLSPAALMIAD